MTYEFKITVTVTGEVTEQEVKDYIAFESGASCFLSAQSPFNDENSGAEIVNIDIN
jgi:hypothetical protein